MEWWTTHRDIAEEPAAYKSVESLSKQFNRFSDQWEGLKWLLARRPDEISYKQVRRDTQYHLTHRKGSRVFDIPDIAAVYTYDDDRVVVYDVMAWETPEDE